MYIKSSDDIDLFARSYADKPELRRGIRLELNGNIADILLVIYRGMGKARTEHAIKAMLNRDGGRSRLTAARDELLAFHHFRRWDVRIDCENTAYLIAAAMDLDWP